MKFAADDELFAYNCLDLHATGLAWRKLNSFNADAMSLFDHALNGPALTMGLRGLRVDERAAAEVLEATWDEARRLRRLVDAIQPFAWSRTAIKPSPMELARTLYDRLRAPVQTNRDGGRTCSKEALEVIQNSAKSSEEAATLAGLALELSRLEEDRKVLVKPRGRDGRIHSGLGVAATVTSRWSSRRDAFGEGTNLHALSRRVRRIFIADPGKVLVNRDLAQAESYVVAYLANCEKYKQWHRSGNVHMKAGEVMWPKNGLDKKAAKVTPVPFNPDITWYDLYKRRQHAGNYGQTAAGFSRIAHIPLAEAKRSALAYFAELPEIPAWHGEVERQLTTFKCLTTPLGRIRHFLGRSWSHDTLKEAIAHVPQSTVSDINKIILWRIWKHLDPWLAEVLLEVHDSVLAQVPEARVPEFLEASGPLARVEIPVNGDLLVIGSSVGIGRNWGSWSEDNPEGLKE